MVKGSGTAAEVALEAAGVAARDLSVQISILQAQLVEQAAVIKANEDHLCGGGVSWWLSMQAGLTKTEADRAVAAVDSFESCPKLFDAFARGAISAGTLAALQRVATVENQDELLATCEVSTARQIESAVRTMARALKDDDPVEPEDRLSFGYGRDGRWKINGDLSADVGAEADRVLNAMLARLTEQARGDDCDDPDVFLRTCPFEERDDPSKADAFIEAARLALFGLAGDTNRVPETHQVIVHANLQAFLAAYGLDVDAPLKAWIEGGGAFDPARLSGLLDGSASVRFLMLDAKADPLFLTKPSRTATPNQLRALYARDTCCQWPGCGRTRRLKAHHVTFWSDGGETVLHNLVLVCGKHHRLIHTHKWRLDRDHGTGVVSLFHPKGHLFDPPNRRWMPPPDPPPDVSSRRFTGTGDANTFWARDTILANWLTHTTAA